MARSLALLLLGLCLSLAARAQAQAPHALPAHVTAQIGLPGSGPARFANLTLTLGALPWVIEGCIASSAGVCFATARVELTEPQRRELVVILQLLAQRMRCPPPAAEPGDPAFTITTPSDVWQGALPADPARIAARTSGQCAAASQLAWWLASRFQAGTTPTR
jgi:hypothetical protein